MNRSLLNLLLGIIQKGNQDLTPVRNLLGAPISIVDHAINNNATSSWKIYTLSNVIRTVPLSPDDILNQINTLQLATAPIVTAVDGITVFSTTPGTTLSTTIANVPQPVSVRVEVDAPGRQIAIYSHETLMQRGSNSLVAYVSLPTGKTAINVVTQGSQNSNIILNLPPDINTDYTAFAPPAPSWIDSGALNTDYIDPTSGHFGVQLFWKNQSSVGGWDVYRTLVQDFGTITQCSTVDGKYVIVTNFSGTALLPYPGSICAVGQFLIGILEDVVYSVDYNQSTFLCRSFDNGDSVFSGTLSTINFNNIGVVQRNSNDSIISFVDFNVQMGTTYSYTIDSFSPIDPTLRSDKISVLAATTPNIPDIGVATLTETSPNVLTLALSSIDNQVRYWSGWIRKNNWPTVLSGSASAQLNPDYLKFYDEDANQATFSFTATNGFWYGIIVPYDANNNSGPRTLCSGQVTGFGVSSGIPTITSVGIDLITNGAGVKLNKIWWTTNSAGEKPVVGSGYQIQVIAFNSIETPSGAADITTPKPRFLWQDWEDTQTNFGDTTNSILLYGSMLDPFAEIDTAVDLAAENRIPKYSVWYYTLNIRSNDGTSILSTYHTQIGGNYSSNPVSGGGGGSGGQLKK